MNVSHVHSTTTHALHTWLRTINVAYLPGPGDKPLANTVAGVLRHFRLRGHNVQNTPDDLTDVILTTACFGEPVAWREAPFFYARRNFKLNRTPTIYAMVQVRPAVLQERLNALEELLKKEPPEPSDYNFPGMSAEAYRVLFEQGRRGGPMLALERVVQAQAKSIRILLVVGEERPQTVYHFDLVGAFPKSEAAELDDLYDDVVLRIVTTMSTREVTQHAVSGDLIRRPLWESLTTPAAMSEAGRELGKRGFFTEMVRISDLVAVPAVTDGVASQYSEGCFATWDPQLGALVATVTGSARPVDKGKITEDDLAVIVGVRAGGVGALVRHVEGKRNDPPSTEAVEMMDMDERLPRVDLDPSWGLAARVPVVRSKLHGHRGIRAFDPLRVEHVPLDSPYYHYLVSCATEAQAQGIKSAFARSEALQNPDDPRQVVFTVLPGHGAVIAEKWVPGTVPFQTIWEYMDRGYLQVTSRVPQGPLSYEPGEQGLLVVRPA